MNMANIELIKGADNGNPSDKLSQAYPKINRSMTNINNQVVNQEGRLVTAEAAVTDHGSRILEAEAELVDHQAQINTLVINGDSSAAAAQAAIDATGYDYENLKLRLDTEHGQLSAQLADIAINVKTFGAVGDGIVGDSNAIINANDYLASQAFGNSPGGTILFPNGIFYLDLQIKVSNNVKIMGSENTTLLLAPDVIAFDISNCSNIRFSNLKIDGSRQKGRTYALNGLIVGAEIQDLLIDNLDMFNGAQGINISNVTNFTLVNNKAEGFSGWAFNVEGYVTNAVLSHNVSFNSARDGLKMSGQLNDVIVSQNICYGHEQDGFDFAGHSIDGLKVFDNIFRDNALEGIEIKTLTRTIYPLPPDLANPVYQNVEVYNNTLLRNRSFGINITNQYASSMPTKNVVIRGNAIASLEVFTAQHYGMRVAFVLSDKGDVLIEYNKINGLFEKGIRLIDSKNVWVRNNIITTYNRGIETEQQTGAIPVEFLYIEENDITSQNASCIYLLSPTANTLVLKNKCQSPASQYRINNLGTGNLLSRNEVKGNFTAAPTGRATQGEIAYSVDMITSGCLGWLATTTASTATWKPFGAVLE